MKIDSKDELIKNLNVIEEQYKSLKNALCNCNKHESQNFEYSDIEEDIKNVYAITETLSRKLINFQKK